MPTPVAKRRGSRPRSENVRRRLLLRRRFAEQEHGLRQRYGDWIMWMLGVQLLVADAIFVDFAWAGRGWDLAPGVIEVWLAATVVQVVGVVAIVTRHLFPESGRGQVSPGLAAVRRCAGVGPSSARPGGRRGRWRGLGARPSVRGGVRPRSRALGGGRGRRRSGGRRRRRGRGGDGGGVLVHEVDLGAGALEPGEAAVEGVGDLGEAEDREELDGAVEIGGARPRCRRAGASGRGWSGRSGWERGMDGSSLEQERD